MVASQEWESFGWTVIEAMVRSKPVVSTNAGGLAEVIGQEELRDYAIEIHNYKKVCRENM